MDVKFPPSYTVISWVDSSAHQLRLSTGHMTCTIAIGWRGPLHSFKDPSVVENASSKPPVKRPVEQGKDGERVDGMKSSLFSKSNEEKLTVWPKLAEAIFVVYSNLSTDQTPSMIK